MSPMLGSLFTSSGFNGWRSPVEPDPDGQANENKSGNGSNSTVGEHNGTLKPEKSKDTAQDDSRSGVLICSFRTPPADGVDAPER